MVTPLKSPLDIHAYRYIQLSNGLCALLVSSCDYGEPCRKKMAFTHKNCRDDQCSDDKTKEFDNNNSPKLVNNPPSEPTADETSSLLDKIVYLSTTILNLFKRNSMDVPTENLSSDDDEVKDYPQLTEKQKRAACTRSQKYDMLASVAINVKAGFFDDPIDMEGTAHLVEHTLFMACQAYPKGGHFDDFLDYTRGSSWNGNTDGHRTVYYFDTSTDYLAEALDIMAEHFKNPSFNVESVVKERGNLDSEFRQALPLQQFRCHHFLQMLSTPGLPYNKFAWGNAETLGQKSDGQVCEVLRNFYRKFYSADSMFLAVQAALTLNELEDLVRENLESIPIRKVDRTPMNKLPMPFSNPRFTRLYKVVITTQTRLLIVTWQLPPEAWKMYNVKPLDYIGYILLNENVDGLPHYLRQRGFIKEVTLTPIETNLERSDACALFSIHFHLTKYGLEQYLQVLEALFSFIQMMIYKGPQFFIFSELSKIKSMVFHYLSEKDIGLKIKELSEAMRIYPPEDVLCGPHLIRSFDKELISRLTSLLKPDVANYQLISKDFDSLQCLSTEKYFKIKYQELDFPVGEMKRLKEVKPFKEFCFCKPNPFIPTNFCLVPPDCPEDLESLFPTCILDPNYPPDKQLVNFWFIQDDNATIPQAAYTMTISSPVSNESAYNAVMLDIFAALFQELFKGHAFSAATALLKYTVGTTSKGLLFRLAGFNDKLPLLLEQTVKQFCVVEEQMEEGRFSEIVFQVREEYENKLIQPCVLSSDVKKSILLEQCWSLTDRYRACTGCEINLSRFKIFVANFKRRLHIRIFADGNVSRTIARQLIKSITDTIRYEPIPIDEYPKNRTKLLPLGERCIRVRSYNFEGDTSVVKSFFQIGLDTPYNRAICEYIFDNISAPLFNSLRTQKQLTYDPEIIVRKIYGALALQIHLITPADKHDPDYIDKEIDNFIQKFYNTEVCTLTEAKFKYVREMYVQSKLNNIESMEGCDLEWEKIVYENVNFTYLVEELKIWKTLRANDIKNFFKKYLLRPSYVTKHYPEFLKHKNCIEYRKLSVQIIGYKKKQRKRLRKKHPTFSVLKILKDADTNKHEDYLIEDVNEFKAHLFNFPAHF